MRWLILLLCVAWPAMALPAMAQMRVSRCALIWENPAKNTDGTPLTDLGGIRLYATQKGSGKQEFATPLATVATTQPGATMEAPCAFPTAGSWWLVARAYDTAEPPNESQNSNEIHLVWDREAPATLTIRITIEVGR
jgi:hypothetical protein